MKAWKVQKFAGDVVYDLRSRGLLPLAILLVVAMVAVPLYLAQGSSDSPPPAAVGGASAAELAPENQSAVVAYEPGVRNYKERLDDRAEKDPFIQQFPPAGQASDALSAASAATSGGDASVPSLDGGGTVPSTGGGAGGPGGGGGGGTVWRRITYRTDVAVGEAGSTLQRRNDLKPFAYLPSQAAPVLSYMGTLGSGERAMFLVSQDVVGQSGAGSCFPNAEQCQLLALKQGKAHELVFGPTNTAYRIKVVSIDRKVKILGDEPPE